MPRQIVEKIYNALNKGTVNIVEAENIEDGAASTSINFLTELDKIILTYGRKRLGAETAGSSPVLGLHSITKLDGTDMLFRKISTFLQYYDASTDSWQNIKNDLDGSSKMYFDNYYSPSSRQVWASGTDGLFKLYPTSPTSLINLTNTAKNFKGKIKIENNAMWSWGVSSSPLTLRRSKFNVDSNNKKPAVTIAITDTAGDILTHSQVTVSAVDINTDILTLSAEIVVKTGDIIIPQTTGTVPTGLTAGTQYYAIQVSATTVKVATTLENANTGVAIDITGAGTGTNTLRVGLIDIASKDKILFTSTGTVPTGLTANTGYWAIRIDATHIKVANSYANAVAGTAIDLTAVHTGVCTCTVLADFVGASGSTVYSGTSKLGQLTTIYLQAGAKTLNDNMNGGFQTDGTGTINYATGAYSGTFSIATVAEVYAYYLYEDPTNGGIADFTYATSRLSTDGFILQQAAVGTKTFGVVGFDGKMYSLQDKGAWRVSIDATGLIINNEIFNSVIGTSSELSYIQVADGIIFLDVFDPAEPKLRKLSYNVIASDKMVPEDLSANFRLTPYYFDKSPMVLFGKRVVFSCRTKNSAVNNRMIVYRTDIKTFDVIDGGYDWLEVANNKLYGGDSTSPNVYELLSGFDDLDFAINASWEGKNDTLDNEQVKKIKKLWVEGYIGAAQGFQIYAAYDRGAYTLLGSISGSATYVETGQGVTVGTALYAENMYGGEGAGTTAYFYKHMIKVRTPKFARIKLKIVPTGVGYLAIDQIKISDIRDKGFKTLKKYK